MQSLIKCLTSELQKKIRRSRSFILPPQSISVSPISSYNFVFNCIFRLILPSSSPRWHKHQIDIKMYIAGVVQVDFFYLDYLSLCCQTVLYVKWCNRFFSPKLLSSLSQSTVIDAVLRHAHQMVPFYLCLPKQCRILVKVSRCNLGCIKS